MLLYMKDILINLIRIKFNIIFFDTLEYKMNAHSIDEVVH